MEGGRYAGIILYRIQRSTEFLLCAIRETVDITGLSAKSINISDPSFRIEIKYLSGTTPKHVVYFVASIASKERIIPSGLAGLNMAWLPLAQAAEKSMYKNMQDALRQANGYIELLKTRVPSPMSSSNRYLQGSGGANGPAGSGKSSYPGGMKEHAGERNRNPVSSHGDRRRQGGGKGRGGGNGDEGENTFGARGRRESGRGSPESSGFLNGGARGGSNKSGKSMSMSIGEDGHITRGFLSGSVAERAEKRLVFAPNGSKDWRAGASFVSEGAAYPMPGSEAGGKDAASQMDNPLYKTRLCERYETEGTCPYGARCTFAHGTTELRDRATFGGDQEQKGEGPENPLYKTRLCERFIKENFCQYGPRCNFAHNPEELRTRPASLGSTASDVVGPTAAADEVREVAQKQPASSKAEHHVLNSVPSNILAGAVKVVRPGGKKNDNISLKDLMDVDKYGKKNSRVVEVVGGLSPHTAEAAPTGPDLSPRSRGYSNIVGPLSPNDPSCTFKYTKVEEMLIAELSKYFSSAPDGGRTLTEETKEITRVEFKHDLTKQQLFTVLIHALFDAEYTATDQAAFLKAWDKAMQRTAGLMKKAALVFKNLYDADLVEEDVFLTCEKKCQPLVEWFRTAEEEED
ncbi:hypothetical protein BC829DRAFT_404125 [Chytridium lagenaria]|nr:hypothetical protein BC829DRAFT_404125 [Chytridium lagenaria]